MSFFPFLIKSLIFAILTGVLFFSFLQLDKLFKVNEVLSISDDGSLIDLNGKDVYLGKRIYTLSKNDIFKHLASSNPKIKLLSVELNYPSKIHIYYEDIAPVAVFETDNGFFLLSSEGKIIAKVRDLKEYNLPLIKYYRPITYFIAQVGESMPLADVVSATTLISFLTDVESTNFVLSINTNGDLIIKDDKFELIFTINKDLKLQAYQYKESIKYLTLEGKNFAILDFRFEKTVVRY
jgi:hypothetical protein